MECYTMMTQFAVDSEENLNHLSEKFRSTLDDSTVRTVDDFKHVFVKKIDEYISAVRYLESKGFDSNLGGMMNPFKMLWGTPLDMNERYISFFITLEEWFGADDLIIKDSNGDEKPAYQVLDDLIIDHGNKFLNAFPYQPNDQRVKGRVDRAIFRKQNPDIYSAYRWISRNHRDKPEYIDWYFSGSIFFNHGGGLTTISKEALNGILLIPCMNSSEPGCIKELDFSSINGEVYKLMQENLPGIKIQVDY